MCLTYIILPDHPMGIVGSRAHPEVADHLPESISLSNGAPRALPFDRAPPSRSRSNDDSRPSSLPRSVGRNNESPVPFPWTADNHGAADTQAPASSPHIDRLRTNTSDDRRSSLDEPQDVPGRPSLTITQSAPDVKPPPARPKHQKSRAKRFLKAFIPSFSTKPRRDLTAEPVDPNDLSAKIKRRLPEQGGMHKQGGFSDVYEGWMTDTNQRIAIKCLRAVHVDGADVNGPDVQDRLHKRLMREMLVLGKVRHIRIAHLMGHALFEGRPALITPWYSNGSLSEYLPKCKEVDRKRIIIHVGEGLACLHSHVPPIAHSDIKPGNVLIDDEGNAAMSDFGLAKVLDGEHTGLTTSGDPKYTIRYCAPEALDGSPGSTMADVYSYACLIYEILSGREPFSEIHAMTHLLVAKANAKLPDRPEFSTMPDPVWALLTKCWSIEPKDRPTMDEVMAELSVLNWLV